MNLLDTYVRAWRESADAVLGLAAGLDADDWNRPTDCPGWTVQDVVAHLAHLESVLATPASGSAAGEASREVTSSYTEAGVVARRHRSTAELVDELATAVDARTVALTILPDDPQAPAPVTPGNVPWSWDTLLRNRAVDLWVHEQDIRRAIDRPGGLDTPGAHVVTASLSLAMPFVLGKRVRPPAGTVVRWVVTGPVPADLTIRVDDDGRALAVDDGRPATTTLTMSGETFTVLAAGRRGPDDIEVVVDGDVDLGRNVLTAMAVTP